jgi:hypothetical protein
LKSYANSFRRSIHGSTLGITDGSLEWSIGAIDATADRNNAGVADPTLSKTESASARSDRR